MQGLPYDELSSQDRALMRDAYTIDQKGLCYHCQQPLNGEPAGFIMRKRINKALFPANFFTFPVHLHHSHETGLTIGAIHARCNATLWEHYGE